MTDEISVIKEFFVSHQVCLCPIWLKDCVKWCKEEALPQNYTIKDLKYEVYEQWLLLDLRDVEVPCLPLGLSTKQKHVLSGNYSLQLMKIVDISKPKYWQIQRIRQETSKNLEKDETASSKRVLMLTLSDGVQEIEAMEYKPIPALNLNLTPGNKIRLMGPINIRRGVLMLETNNIKVLGGEVETLKILNAAENILAASLNLPLNPNPFCIQESLLMANTDILENNEGMQSPKLPKKQTSIIQQTILKQNTTLNNQNDLQKEEIKDLMEIEQEFGRSRTNKTKSQTPDLFEDMDIDDAALANINIPTATIVSSSKSKNNYINFEIDKVADLSQSLDSDNDVFENFDLDAHLDTLDKKIAENDVKQETVNNYQLTKGNKICVESETKPIKVDGIEMSAVSEPKARIWTLNKLITNLQTISNGKFKVKAKFQTVIEKLTLLGEEFHLVIGIEDESGIMTVKVHSDVVAQWAECTAIELSNFRAGIQEKMVDAQHNLLKVLQTLKENVQKLDNVVEILINSKESHPILTKVLS